MEYQGKVMKPKEKAKRKQSKTKENNGIQTDNQGNIKQAQRKKEGWQGVTKEIQRNQRKYK